ncbi:MAG TPA: hypothetical protein VIQ24_14140, partial [Pyrinomonadaceae bacterium]
MFVRTVMRLMLGVLIGSTMLVGQDNVKELDRQLALLVKPTNIKVDIIQRELELNEDQISEQYKEGDDIHFRVQLTNTSVLPALVLVSDPYFQNRPELSRDGQEVSYRRE